MLMTEQIETVEKPTDLEKFIEKARIAAAFVTEIET